MSHAHSSVILYTFRRCPYAMRARLALLASQIGFEHREVDLKHKPAHMLSLSPKGTVPVLWLPEGGTVIDESLDIMFWALRKNDANSWLPKDEKYEMMATKLFQENDEQFKLQLDRYKYPSRFGLDHEGRLAQRDSALVTLSKLEAQLGETAFLSGETFGLIDAGIAPFIRQFAKVDEEWFLEQPFKRIASWLRDFESSQLFIEAMKKVPVWMGSDKRLPEERL